MAAGSSGSLDYRPVTALFGAAVLVSLVFMYMHTNSELAPAEDQGVLFAITKAPQYANLDYSEAYDAQARPGARLVSRDRSALYRQRQFAGRTRASPASS